VKGIEASYSAWNASAGVVSSATVGPSSGSDSSADPPPEIKQSTASAAPAPSGNAKIFVRFRRFRSAGKALRSPSARHRPRGLARPDDGHPALRRRRQMRRNAMRRLRRLDCGVEHPSQKSAGIKQFAKRRRYRDSHCETPTIGGNGYTYSKLLDGRSKAVGSWQVRRVEEYIEANRDQPIAIESLAVVVNASARGISHSFRAHRNCSSTNFVKHVRLKHAEEMLRAPAGEMSVRASPSPVASAISATSSTTIVGLSEKCPRRRWRAPRAASVHDHSERRLYWSWFLEPGDRLVRARQREGARFRAADPQQRRKDRRMPVPFPIVNQSSPHNWGRCIFPLPRRRQRRCGERPGL
jgi:AraC-like DNA-binding protein